MNSRSLYPCGRVSRRGFVTQAAGGFFGAALGGLLADDGKLMDGTAFGDNVAEIKRPVIPCIRTFKPSGQSGTPVSDILPNVAGVIDEIAVVRSMWNHEGNHFPAVIETATGHRGRAFDHPSLGGWVSYALGSA